MTQQAYAAHAASRPSTPALHLPDVVRAVMMLVGVGVFAKFTVLNEHLIFGPFAWIAFLGYVAIGVAAAARLALVDAAPARDPYRSVQRTRQIGVIKEIVIAGTGALMLIAPATYLVMVASQELWGGRARPSGDFSLGGLLVTAFFALLGFFMTFYRPQFVLDAQARKIVRYAFGRSIPLRVKELPYADLAVYSDGYFITNTGHRLGDMIRGRAGKYTFELEMLRGLAPAAVQARAMAWASALGATYRTPEQAAAMELGIGR